MTCRAAKVVIGTYAYHRREDPVFAEQCEEAEAQAVQLLQDACWKSAVEGDAETVYYMGIPVGYIKKFDSRLRVEMLRAHVPGKFKSPGVNVQVNHVGRTYRGGTRWHENKRQRDYDAFHAALYDAHLRRQWTEEVRRDEDIKRKRAARAARTARRSP